MDVMEVDPLSERERVEKILQNTIYMVYDMPKNEMRFWLQITQEKTINYVLALEKIKKTPLFF